MHVRIAAALVLLIGTDAVAQVIDGADARSKKELQLAEKVARRSVRRARAPATGKQPAPPVSLVNLWTHEVLPVDPSRPASADAIDRFLRCHYTNRTARVDDRLVPLLLRAAARFKSGAIEIVSAYRSPKYNLMLRKKGREVARESQHPLGHAVDFRLPGLRTRTLLQFIRSLGAGGVGYYPRSDFVHADVGPIRFWKGH